MKRSIILSIFILGIVFSGCIDSINNKKIDISTYPNNSSNNKQISDSDKIIGTWSYSRVVNGNDIYTKYIFNSDGTGIYDSAFSETGKKFFKYEFGKFPTFTENSPISDYTEYRTEEECKLKSFSGKCTLHTKYIRTYDWKPSPPSQFEIGRGGGILDYDLIDNDNLILDGVTFERK